MPHVIIHDVPSVYDQLVAGLQILFLILRGWF